MKFQALTLAATALLVASCAPVDAYDPAPMPPGDGPTQCKADHYQRYVGRNRSELPVRPWAQSSTSLFSCFPDFRCSTT